ncbi:hypothetical protein [Aestuariivirga sp.]|uniref:hypothetical protein n=1 Tax=Aestuariivirga sp. TaxID=2650926 RepID=UPI0039E65C14
MTDRTIADRIMHLLDHMQISIGHCEKVVQSTASTTGDPTTGEPEVAALAARLKRLQEQVLALKAKHARAGSDV